MKDKAARALRRHLIAQRFLMARREAGISQEELARQCGVSGATITNLERERNSCDIPHLEIYARHLGKPLQWFLSDELEGPIRSPQAIYGELTQYLDPWLPVLDGIHGWRQTSVVGQVAAMGPLRDPERMRAYRIPGLELPPGILEGDTLMVDREAVPETGDVVMYGFEREARLALWPITGEQLTGVVVQIVRQLRDRPNENLER